MPPKATVGSSTPAGAPPASVPSKFVRDAVTAMPVVAAQTEAALKNATAGSAASASGSSTGTGGSGEPPKQGRFRARYQAFQGTRVFKGFSFVNKYRRSFLFGAFVLYSASSYVGAALHARRRDRIRDSTYLYWKIYDGSIVEAKSSTTVLNSLLFSSGPGGSDEPARIMTIFDVVRTLNWAMRDDRIVGLLT